MVILNREDLKTILSTIKRDNLVERLCLTTGNCGVLAIALKHLLGEGEIWMFDWHSHCVLFLDQDKFVDGTGVLTEQELLSAWKNCSGLAPNPDEEDIVGNTGHTFTVRQMENILMKILRGESVEYYTNPDHWYQW